MYILASNQRIVLVRGLLLILCAAMFMSAFPAQAAFPAPDPGDNARRYYYSDWTTPRVIEPMTRKAALASGECKAYKAEITAAGRVKGIVFAKDSIYINVEPSVWNKKTQFVTVANHGRVRFVIQGIPPGWVGVEEPILCSTEWLEKKGAVSAEITDEGHKFIITVMNYILVLVGQLGLWLMTVVTSSLVFLVGIGEFRGHELVVKGWPFMQGIANIGFILTLLAIAAATTLRIQNYDVRRLLPRLLIAALLINFSLLIGTVLIDSSRLIMAAELRVYGKDINTVTTDILKNSGLPETASKFTVPGNHSWKIPLNLLQKVMLIWALTIGIVYVSVLLFVRYIALLILLVFSPFAYLAAVLPKTASMAQAWWTQFIKWTMYGPIMLLFLILISFVGKTLVENKANTVFLSFLNVFLMAGMLMIAAKVGTMLGGAGATAAIGFTSRTLKRAPRFAYKHPRTTAAIAGGVATGGLGGAALGAGAFMFGRRTAKGAYQQMRDFARPVGLTAWKAAKKLTSVGRLGSPIFGPERDEKGELLKGERGIGDRLGRRLSGAIGGVKIGGEEVYGKGRQLSQWERDMEKTTIQNPRGPTAADRDLIRDPKGAFSRLNVKEVGTAMTPDKVKAVMKLALSGVGTGAQVAADAERLKIMINNEYAYNNMDYDDRTSMMAINVDQTLQEIEADRAAAGEAKLTSAQANDYRRFMRDAKQAASSQMRTVLDPKWV